MQPLNKTPYAASSKTIDALLEAEPPAVQAVAAPQPTKLYGTKPWGAVLNLCEITLRQLEHLGSHRLLSRQKRTRL
jgi:hypothetical protein